MIKRWLGSRVGRFFGAVVFASGIQGSIARRRAIRTQRAALTSLPPSTAHTISVIIPALNEEKNLKRAIESTGLLSSTTGLLEVIVVDGGSSDNTVAVAKGADAKVFSSPKGRGKQLIAGALQATGDVLLFLHADSSLPPGYSEQVLNELAKPVYGQLPVWGCFQHMAIKSNKKGLRLLERGISLRTRLFRTPYGDQGIFVRRSLYEELDGFKDWPLFEDYEMVQRLRKITPPALVQLPLSVDARRWEKLGVLRTVLVNQYIIVAYHMGVSPHTLANMYYQPTGLLKWLMKK